ncbi:ATP-binding protein [Pseudodesulfovibrio sp.]|nr:ATP-binding protein [Pseudodesulfovibrio sp.]
MPIIRVDADLFIQVLINIINNAVKFTEKGTITLSVEVTTDNISFKIADEGYGINPANLKNVFDKFFIIRSGDTLSNQKLGTGLGLPICKEIIEHYDGKIWAESDGMNGSVFHIMLPAEIIT